MDQQDEGEAILVMGDEEYDEPDQLLAGLPERVLLSDFVESRDTITNAIAKVRTSMMWVGPSCVQRFSVRYFFSTSFFARCSKRA